MQVGFCSKENFYLSLALNIVLEIATSNYCKIKMLLNQSGNF